MGLRGVKPRPLRNRIYEKVEITQGCWLWHGLKNENGYGLISIAGLPRTGRRTFLLHRVVYEMETKTKIPEGMHVLHSCDTPNCIRLSHLRIGTHAENMRDMDERRRCARRRKLTDEQATEILASDESNKELAARFPISESGIRSLRKRGGYKSPESTASPYPASVFGKRSA